MNPIDLFLLLILSILWGGSFVFMRFLSPVFGPFITAGSKLFLNEVITPFIIVGVIVILIGTFLVISSRNLSAVKSDGQ
jgi:drug/metabolite transporter (DMT)-like permease